MDTFVSAEGLGLNPVAPGHPLQLQATGAGIVMAHGDKEVFHIAQS
jgi:hypothetical protein